MQPNPKKKLTIGVSDFKEVINDDLYFIDKSLFIKDVVDDMKVLLYPRRFGKTLNLSMLKYFYECTEDNSDLFNELKISKEEDIMKKQGKYPVIYLTFKDIKDESKDNVFKGIYELITELYIEKKYILNDESLGIEYTSYFNRILSAKADYTDYLTSLKYLTQFMYKYHKINPVVLIDEYDTPIHAGYSNNYYKPIIGFMRDFLSGGLKDNKYLEKAVLTGILRVSQESIFTGLNNIKIHSILTKKSSDKFGFTNDEVEQLLRYYNSELNFEDVKKKYNGYNFSGNEIYNPWSILNAVYDNELGHYWLNTSSNELIKSMCEEADDGVKNDLQVLATGGRIGKHIKEETIFPKLKTDKNAIWSFFIFCGYLRYDNYVLGKKQYEVNAELSVPNEEIAFIFDNDIIPYWFIKKAQEDIYVNFSNLLINGDIEIFKKEFTEFCLTSFSYHDVTEKTSENFYHAFVLGMASCLKSIYQIRSNRESGLGRYDIILIPNDISKRGIIFEFKNLDIDEDIPRAIEYAKRQVDEKKYDQELKARGVCDIVHLVAVFKGKEVLVVSL